MVCRDQGNPSQPPWLRPPLTNGKYHLCHRSFNERKAAALASKYGKEWLVFSENRLSRVYPIGTRFKSSNFEPMQFWK